MKPAKMDSNTYCEKLTYSSTEYKEVKFAMKVKGITDYKNSQHIISKSIEKTVLII